MRNRWGVAITMSCCVLGMMISGCGGDDDPEDPSSTTVLLVDDHSPYWRITSVSLDGASLGAVPEDGRSDTLVATGQHELSLTYQGNRSAQTFTVNAPDSLIFYGGGSVMCTMKGGTGPEDLPLIIFNVYRKT